MAVVSCNPITISYIPYPIYHILYTISYIPYPIYHIHRPKGIKYLTRLRVGLSHLRAYKYHHNFRDTVNPLCSCDNNDIESTEYYLLHCSTYLNIRHVLFERLRQIISLVTLIISKYTCDLLLYGNPNYDSQTNKIIIESTIESMISSKRFDLPLLYD